MIVMKNPIGAGRAGVQKGSEAGQRLQTNKAADVILPEGIFSMSGHKQVPHKRIYKRAYLAP
jgi:uncharacterized protein YjlB